METFVLKFSEIVNEDITFLTADRQLSEIPLWDSMSMLVFVALADQEYGIKLKSAEVKVAQTVGDLYALLVK